MRVSLDVELKAHRDVLIVRLTGELDHHTADDVRRQIDQELDNDRYPHVILNLGGLTFMDSSGLGVILGRYKRINEHNGTLVVCQLHPPIKKLFKLSGMFKIVNEYRREEDALRDLGVTL
jgi:stage II sporulation protein AA (anti-sigma F factor antagonist)